MDEHNHCIYCERTSDEVPLLTLEFQDQKIKICPQHLPILIHNPAMLVGKMPGAEALSPADHDD